MDFGAKILSTRILFLYDMMLCLG